MSYKITKEQTENDLIRLLYFLELIELNQNKK